MSTATTCIDFRRYSLRQPPAELTLYVSLLLQKEGAVEDERRQSRRFQIALPVPAIVIDEQNNPVGEPFMVMARNISGNGIALVHVAPVDAQRLVIELTTVPGEKTQLVVEVQHCRGLGRFHEIGGRFLCKLPRDS
jgi:hypothetical protein